MGFWKLVGALGLIGAVSVGIGLIVVFLFGQAAGRITVQVLFFGLCGWTALVAIVRSLRAGPLASEIVAYARQHPRDAGPYAAYFDQGNGHADDISISRAVSDVIRAYGGKGVVKKLIREGYEQIVYNDVIDVFGSGRGDVIYGRIVAKVHESFLFGTLLPFGIGAVAGYKATVRK